MRFHARYRFLVFLPIGILLGLNACQKEEGLAAPNFQLLTPRGFPEMDIPSENQLTESRWLLGRKLFYDPILSRDSSISCSSCHNPSFAFSDHVSFSAGVDGRLGTRNSSTLTNIGYNPYFTREGGVPTLEMQVLIPVEEHAEMDFNIVAAGDRLKTIPAYIALSQKAYNMEPDYYVITRALACFERTLVSGNSRFDQYEYQGNLNILSDAELRGKELFFSSRTNCSACHGGFNFTNYSFENNGLYEVYADKGRYKLTSNPEDAEKFKVPTLRNVGVTGPYMHDGSMLSLEDIIEHYNLGGALNQNKSALVKVLNLNQQEKQDLLAFLNSLTDASFINDEKFKP